MAVEIERKFLVCSDAWRGDRTGVRYVQGYLCSDAERAVRVRLEGSAARLTVKSGAQGIVRQEFDYPIPVEDARAMLDNLCCGPLVDKRRYRVEHAGHIWEVDEFAGANAGLVVAEIELDDPEEAFERPSWVGPEVTDDPRYLNSNLSRHPYTAWGDAGSPA